MIRKLVFIFILSLMAVNTVADQQRYVNEVFEEVIRTSDIQYGQNDNDLSHQKENLTFRLFEPKGDTNEARVLLILTPGGGFVNHDDHWMDDFGIAFAKAGYVVAINRFRLSKSIDTDSNYYNAIYKAQSDQKALIRFFIKDNEGKNKYRIDVNNIFIGGHSAGATTSMFVAYADPKDKITEAIEKHAINYAGLDGNSGNPGFSYTIRGVVNLSGIVSDPDMFKHSNVPLLSIHGEKDNILRVDENGLYHAAISIQQRFNALGMKNKLYIIDEAGHNDSASTQLCPECVPIIRRFMAVNIVK
ncbi:alpha/beta hydrolase [Microbulbifer hydrolyticus]|uniref:Poly(3-hydroxybutyrate) depolymerase n=1 Tax=Microbulbifer hydrolyticus TaxID=48074 RepID=A0A6P1T7Z5_9GAMM|nr:hypothetical protein [Microbulbifer hydrolyticus]MBB5211410.1 poly(3-hydroxybutyrate) depolymerase [Microbulbifer hydrolyticus]QHQ37835.1 hypothetical protein GTQ55_01720 [Microbulbifer hydrolyticus]